MGKDKIKLYQYSSLEDGCKYLRSYESMSEVWNIFYDDQKYPFFRYNPIYHELPNGTYISKIRIGRDRLKKEIRKQEDPTCYTRNDDKEIVIYNSLGEEVGFVKNKRIAEALIKTKNGNLNARLHRNKISTLNFGELNFIYKI